MSTPTSTIPTVSTKTLLSRQVGFSPDHLSSPIQNQVDHLVSGFVDQATDWKTLASLTAGGLAYRWGKASILSLDVGARCSVPLRAASIVLGLGAEVTAFELTNRVLRSVPLTPALSLEGEGGGKDTSRLWSWSGPGGWKQSLIADLITFGTLKGAGHLGRESNVILQHSFASTAMVAGHQVADVLGILPSGQLSAPTLAEQFLHAEMTNIQLGAGTSLVHAIAPGLTALERGLDLSLRLNVGVGLVSTPRWEWWTPWEGRTQGPPLQPSFVFAVGAGFNPTRAPENPHILHMSSQGGPQEPSYGGINPPQGSISLKRMQLILSRLPEVAAMGEPASIGPQDLPLLRNPKFRVVGQLIRRLQTMELPPSLAQAWERALWELEPPSEGASLESIEKGLEEISRRAFYFYLQNRDQIYALANRSVPDWETLHRRDEAAFSPFWELRSIPDERIEYYQESTHTIFSYALSKDLPYWAIYFRDAQDDMGRILVTKEALGVILNELKHKGEFSFPPSKEAVEESPLKLTKDDFDGAIPLSPFTLTQLALEPLFSPSLFKAVFGLMDHILTLESAPNLADEVKLDMRRAAMLILLGGNERAVLDSFRERILKKYYQNRESFIDRIDFLRYEENFLTLPGLSPSAHLSVPAHRSSFLRFVDGSNLPLEINHDSVLVLGMLRMIYRTRNQHLIHQLHYQAPKDEPAEIPAWIARFYFEHQEEILNLLIKNGEMQ